MRGAHDRVERCLEITREFEGRVRLAVVAMLENETPESGVIALLSGSLGVALGAALEDARVARGGR